MIPRSGMVQQLQAATAALRLVQGLIELAALRQLPPRHLLPAAYVVPVSERAGDNRLTNAVAQRGEAVFGVLLVLSDLSDPRGDAAGDMLDVVRAEVSAALLGWTPPGATGPLLYDGGDAVDLDPNGAVWWMDRYRAPFALRKTR